MIHKHTHYVFSNMIKTARSIYFISILLPIMYIMLTFYCEPNGAYNRFYVDKLKCGME